MDNILFEIKNELDEIRKRLAIVATKEDISKLATREDVAGIPGTKQAVLESHQESAVGRDTTGSMNVDIQDLKEKGVLFEETLMHQRKLIDSLMIKT